MGDSDDEDTVEEEMDVNFAVPNPKQNRRGVLDPTTSITTTTTLKKSKTKMTGRSLHSRVSKLGSSLKSSILLRRSPQTKGPRASVTKKTKPAATATATSFQQEQQQHQQEPRPRSQRPRRKRRSRSHMVTVITVEDASDSECENEFDSPWRNRRPAPGMWIEPVEPYYGHK